MAHGVGDRVRDRGGGADRSALAHPLDAAGCHRRGRLEVSDLEQGHVVRPGKRVVHERRGEQLAVVVVHDGLEQRLADTLGDRSLDLSFDDDRDDLAFTYFYVRIAAYSYS